MGRCQTRVVRLATAIALSAVCSLAQAQTTPATPPAQTHPCTTSPQPQPCTRPDAAARPAAGEATPAQRFPFPGEEKPQATPAPTTNVPSAPDAQPPNKRFPFPGEDPAAPSAPGGSSSSSSSDDPQPTDPDPSAAPTDNAKPDAPKGRRLLKRVNPPGTKLQSPEERVAEDLDVAKFYFSTGDLQGAYLRTQDAVKLAPDDPDAHCGLAEAALKLNKRDEAITEYNACLKLDPEDKLAKTARRQLAKLK